MKSRRSRTLGAKQLTNKTDLAIGALLYPERDYWRPRTRADCERVPRPCPYVSCKYHLYLDVDPSIGSIKLNYPELEPWQLEHSCALDIADQGGITLEEVGSVLRVVRERVRQIESACMDKAREHVTPEGETDLPGPAANDRPDERPACPWPEPRPVLTNPRRRLVVLQPEPAEPPPVTQPAPVVTVREVEPIPESRPEPPPTPPASPPAPRWHRPRSFHDMPKVDRVLTLTTLIHDIDHELDELTVRRRQYIAELAELVDGTPPPKGADPRDAPAETGVVRDTERPRPARADGEGRRRGVGEAMVALIRDRGPMRIADVAAEMGMPNQHVHAKVWHLVKAGRVRRTSPGVVEAVV